MSVLKHRVTPTCRRISEHKRAGPRDGHRETSPFPAAREGVGQPPHKPTSPCTSTWGYPWLAVVEVELFLLPISTHLAAPQGRTSHHR